MFKLLALRPLSGCASYIQKCLKTELMYYFSNDYIIEPNSYIRRRSKNLKPLDESFFSVNSQSDYFRVNNSRIDFCPKVNVSAVVGMNGDGKSTLMELMIRLINNCAISYGLYASSDNLRRVNGVKAELYYLVDNVVYRIAEEEKQTKTEIWEVAKLVKKTSDDGGELVRWDIKPNTIDIKDIPNCFYFTIVSNYSHYAYNVYDYEREWEVRGDEKDDDNKCWLHYIFHKNDGYLTPLTLHPFRYKGNIDINNEKWLSKQRLLSLFLNADNPSEDPFSFRRVNGKDANVLKLKEEPSSKLQGKVLLEYFEKTKEENRFKDLIEAIDLEDDALFHKAFLMNPDEIDNKSFNSLIDISLSSRFIKPINQIIEQDNGRFSIFANEVATWMTKNNKTTNNGDIITLIRHYEDRFEKNETYIQIEECTQRAINNASEGNYFETIDCYNKAKKISEKKLGKGHVFTFMIDNDIALAYEYLGMLDDAIKCYEGVVNNKESILGKDHQSTAITYENMVGVYAARGDYDTALRYSNKAMEIFGKDPLLMAIAYNNTALVFESRGEYGKAKDFYHKAIDNKRANKKSHPDFATTYNNIAGVYEKTGNHIEAISNYKKSLEIRKKEFGYDHLNVAKVYHNMAVVYMNMDEYGTALNFFNAALSIREKKQGADHLDTASLYNSIARVYIAIEDYVKASEFFNKSLSIGKNHPDAAFFNSSSFYSDNAWVCYKKKEYDQSLRFYEKALEKAENHIGEKLPDVAVIYNDMAGVYMGMGRYPKALSYYKKAHVFWGKNPRKKNLDTATTYNNMAVAYLLNGSQIVDSLELLLEALKIRKKYLDNMHVDIATTYDNIALAYKATGDHSNALHYYSKALKIKEKDPGLGRMDICMSYRKIGWEYYELGEYNNALNSFICALETIENNEGIGNQEKIQCYKNISGLYLMMDDNEKALEYHMKSKGVIDSRIKKKIGVEAERPIQISILSSDKLMKVYQKNELIKQVAPSQRRNIVSVENGEMEKIWESHDRMEKMLLNIRKQNLLDVYNHKFLTHINATQLGRLDTIYRIMKSYDIDWEIVTKRYSDLTLKEKCQHYIVYKTWSILSTYPQYKKAYNKDTAESLREFGPKLEECVTDINNDGESHISRKLRQVRNFEKEGLQRGGLYERLKTTRGKSGELLIEIDKLREHYTGKSFSLDNLPPPIYKWDIIFNKKDASNSPIELDSFSSGEKQMLSSIGSVIYHLQNLSNTASNISYHNVNLVMEEIELYYHPEYQRLFFTRLLDMIKRARLHNIQNINIVFVTHSPFILSDIPKCNVLFLKDGMPKDDMQENTFGANIHSLLKNGFFMPNLPIGEFAYEKINKLFGRLNSGDFDSINELDEIYQEILLVGEPFLRNQLLLLYNAYKRSGLKPQF